MNYQLAAFVVQWVMANLGTLETDVAAFQAAPDSAVAKVNAAIPLFQLVAAGIDAFKAQNTPPVSMTHADYEAAIGDGHLIKQYGPLIISIIQAILNILP